VKSSTPNLAVEGLDSLAAGFEGSSRGFGAPAGASTLAGSGSRASVITKRSRIREKDGRAARFPASVKLKADRNRKYVRGRIE
jgi:hypothetical protein